MARVTATENTVTWSQFEQVHRDWSYNDFSLKFDRARYDAALAQVELAAPRRAAHDSCAPHTDFAVLEPNWAQH